MEIAPMGTPERRAQDLEMIQSPDRWPSWPRLPLKKRGSFECGYVVNKSFDDNTVVPKVYLATIFENHNSDNFKEYTNLEALLDDGWTVD